MFFVNDYIAIIFFFIFDDITDIDINQLIIKSPEHSFEITGLRRSRIYFNSKHVNGSIYKHSVLVG